MATIAHAQSTRHIKGMMRQNPYAAHAAFVNPARAYADSWRMGCVLSGVIVAFVLSPGIIINFAPSQAAADAYIAAVTPLATLAQFLSFGITLIAMIYLVNRFHHRGLDSLLGTDHTFRSNLKKAVIAVCILLAVQEPIFLWLDRQSIIEVRDVGQWAIWIFPAIMVLLLQVSTEEILFRGYLQQQLAAWSPSRWIWMGVPSLLFGLAHMPNAEDPLIGVLWVFWAGLLGLACADLTARTGNLGAAIGLHLANNMFALLIVAVSGFPVSGLALFLYPAPDLSDFDTSLWMLIHPSVMFELMLSALAIFVMWMAARLSLRV